MEKPSPTKIRRVLVFHSTKEGGKNILTPLRPSRAMLRSGEQIPTQPAYEFGFPVPQKFLKPKNTLFNGHSPFCAIVLIASLPYLRAMKFNPGEQVIVLDTTNKPVGKAIVQTYHEGTHHYRVLFQYPNTTAPESIELPEHRLLDPASLDKQS
jgi:hypothetical protein